MESVAGSIQKLNISKLENDDLNVTSQCKCILLKSY
jgi:hypothetical protein